MPKLDSNKDYRSGKNSRASSTPRFNNAKFINRDFTAEEKQACKAWQYDEPTAWADMDAISEEYKITFKYDSYSRASACWIQPIAPDHEDAGYILCGRGSSLLKAFKQALFVWRVLGSGETWKQFDSQRTYDLDD